jgi:hypothetical protein
MNEEHMLKKLIASAFVVALSSAAIMQPAHAGAILVKDFYANLDNGSQKLIGTLKVDVDDALQIVDNEYETYSWKSFTLFGKDVDVVDNFYAVFDISNLFAGFTYLTFDVKDLLNDVTFQGVFSDTDGIVAADIYSSKTSTDLYTNGVSVSNTNVISAPATTALLVAGFAGLMLRRRKSS